MAIARTDYTAKTTGVSLLSQTVTGVKVGDIIIAGVAVTGTSHSVFGVKDSASNTYYAGTTTGAYPFVSSPGTGTNPCACGLFVTKSTAAGSITVTVQLGSTDLPSDLLLYVGVFTSNAGGIMAVGTQIGFGANRAVAFRPPGRCSLRCPRAQYRCELRISARVLPPQCAGVWHSSPHVSQRTT